MLRKTLIGLALLLAAAAPASAAPELSVSDRLDDRRYAAIGTRAYSVGTEAGRFPAMGFHTRGEMGGIWTPPLKLLDGLWFAVDGQPVGPATRFSSGYGYVTMDLPAPAGLRLRRTEFAPDHLRALLVGLELRAPGAARTVTVSVDAHSELMSAYPWGESTPSQLDFNLPDSAAADRGRLLFREQGRPPVPNAEVHDWAAVVGASRAASAIETGAGFRGPQEPPVVCGPSGEGQPEPPPRCDDTAYGKGAGGRLEYRLNVPARRHAHALDRGGGLGGTAPPGPGARRTPRWPTPRGCCAARSPGARRWRASRGLSLPGDPLLARGIDWSKQNLADSVQLAEDLEIRETNAGESYPPPEGRLDAMRFLGAGWPDYQWLFATDGEYTAYASVAVGQFEP